MKPTKRQLQELSLADLLRALQTKTSTQPIPTHQQQHLMHLIMTILQTCVPTVQRSTPEQDINEIRGQWHVKRALEVAAAGGHNILLIGPDGAGKAQLARTLRTLLPTSSVPYPVRELASPIGEKAFVGEPTVLGELTLAHTGVLFLKDLDTFDLALLTHLSQAVETHVISVPSQDGCVVLPAQFLLVATIKPCPCGLADDPVRACSCSAQEVVQYRRRIKEVVHTCFAIEIAVPLIGEDLLRIYPREESSAMVRERVETARKIQHRRYAKATHLRVNADLQSVDEVERSCQMLPPARDLLKSALQQLHLTPLQMLRLQAVARTIADLADEELIGGKHMAEAILYLSRFIRYEEHPSLY